MSKYQIQQVWNSWNLIGRVQVTFVTLFYQKLFELATELRIYFKTDILVQVEKLTSTLFSLIKLLEGGFAFGRDVKYLVLRHSTYGAKPEHYQFVGQALLLTTKVYLRDKWNKNLHGSWKELFKELSTAMIKVQSDYSENKHTA